MPRLFTAIELPEPTQQEIVRIQPRDLPDAVPTSQDQMHLTLHFIGQVTDATADRLDTAFHAARFAPFSLALSGVGCFPADDRPGFLWAGVERSPELLGLHQSVGQALESLDFSLEDRAYRPHVTIARLDSPQTDAVEEFLRQNEPFRSRFEVSCFALYSVERMDGETLYVKQSEYHAQ